MTENLLPIPERAGLSTYTILVDGDPLPQEYPVYSVEVRREVNRIPTARICLPDGSPAKQDFPVSASEFFVPGNEIEILAGYHSEESTIFKGIVTKQSLKVRLRRFELEVICKDQAVQTTILNRSRQFVDQTDADIVSAILADYDGLDSELEELSVTHPKMVQYHSTDWDFILSRVESNNLVLVVVDGVIRVLRPTIDEPVGLIRFGDNLLEFNGEIDGRTQVEAATAQAWDPVEQNLLELEAVDPGFVTPGNFAPEDLAAAFAADLRVERHAAG